MLGIHAPKTVVPFSLCTSFHYSKSPFSTIATVDVKPKKNRSKDALWQEQGLVKGKRAPTELLFQQSLKRIFPNETISFKVRKVLNIKRGATRKGYLEIDASIASLKFHAEYQDPYHYTSAIHYAGRPLAEIQDTDAFKREYFAEKGESLLQLPCWWDGTDESLVATIKAMRPDLLQHINPSSLPVLEREPNNFLLHHVVPDVGALMRPVFFSKRYYERGHEWVANEKLDGVRCCWNPKQRRLYSRNGIELRFPEEFKHHMPEAFLDGEIWFGRGRYHESAKVISRRTATVNWPDFRISVFDIAGLPKMTYEERYKKLHSIISNHPFLFIPSVIQVTGEEQRLRLDSMILKFGGEGMILTERNSLYEHGYTDKVLKVKPYLDKEALVVASDNKHLTLKLTDGTRFKIRIPDIRPAARIGDVITFTYNRCVLGTTLPEKPQILRVRSDVTWSEAVASANEGGLNGRGRDYSTRWHSNLDDIRGHFVQFAKDNNFDPLVPANWYNVKFQDILAIQGVANMLRGFNGSIINALIAAFSELEFDKLKFGRVPKHHWKTTQHIRHWFDEFAAEKGFDPLVAQNWYSIEQRNILSQKRARSIISNHFNGSHINALVAAYPEIGMDKSMFSTAPMGYWKDDQNVRKWLENFAKQQGFDPQNANNWYSISRSDIATARKGASSMLRRFNGSHIDALVAVFPEIGLDKSKFATIPKGYWDDVQKTKIWLDQFAKENGFDPLVPNKWYAVRLRDILAKKGAHSMLKQFNGSHINALVAAYPDLEFDKSQFSKVPRMIASV